MWKDHEELLQMLRKGVDTANRLPGPEQRIVRSALQGRSVKEIAEEEELSQEAVWDVLALVAASVSGRAQDGAERAYASGNWATDSPAYATSFQQH